MMKDGMSLLLPIIFIRQQTKSCTGVEISTCSERQIIQYSSHGRLTVTMASVGFVLSEQGRVDQAKERRIPALSTVMCGDEQLQLG